MTNSPQPRQLVLVNDPDDPLPDVVLGAGRRYLASGLSLVPIDPDEGTKRPASRLLPRLEDDAGNWRPTWQPYQHRMPTDEELINWCNSSAGLAVICGRVSGGLECIDCGNWDVAARWVAAVQTRLAGLLEKLPRVCTPRPGLHVYYRSQHVEGNQVLAAEPQQANGRPKRKTLIETRGEGGYCLVPPCPRRCHPSGGLYTYEDGSTDLAQVPVISVDERAVLFNEARRFNTWIEVQSARPHKAATTTAKGGGRPGDDYNRRGSWRELLERHGWLLVGHHNGQEYWRRPAKFDGHSATINGQGLLYVFSSNAAPFEAQRAYSKFAAYALLEHHGDYGAAARCLRDLGYGVGHFIPATAITVEF